MMPKSGAAAPHPPFLSVPTWDICDEEIDEWRARGLLLSAYIARRISDGEYDNGREIFPGAEAGSRVYPYLTRDAVAKAMEPLAERGMVRKEGDRWYAIAPGRMEPSIRRAVATLLRCRADLPPALAAELDSWKLTVDALEASGCEPQAPCGASAGQAAVVRAIRSARPMRVIGAGNEERAPVRITL